MLPPEQQSFFGLTLQRLSVDFGPFGEGTTFTLTLIKESGQNFTLQDVNFRDSIVPIINLKFGELNVIAAVISWKETVIDIGGKSIYVVTLAQYRRLFLNGFSVVETFHMPSSFANFGALINDEGVLEKPFLYRGTVYVPTVVIDETIFGPPITEIFELFKDESFRMGLGLVSFNFDGLNPDFNIENLIKLRSDGKTSLFTIINDYAATNNFDYSLSFELIDGVYQISFVKNTVIEQASLLAEDITGHIEGGILDAIALAQSGQIINYERGFSIDKDFVQNTESFQPVDFGHKQIINIVRGGPESEFLQFTKGDIHQFWGFTASGTLAEAPDDLGKMEQILNNENIIDEDTDLRKFMNLWGRQFIVNSTHLTEIQPLTPEQEEAVAKEEQAMIDLIEALLAYFNELPVRKLGDKYRNGQYAFDAFLDQYSVDNPDITSQAIFDFNRAMLDGPNDTVLLDPDSMVGIFDRELNSLFSHYPSVDDILAAVGEGDIYQFQGFIGLSLKSTQVSLDQARKILQIPASVQVASLCFPSIDHPLANNSLAKENFRASDGRWPSYIELPKLPTSTSRKQYTWASKIISSVNHISITTTNNKIKETKHYIKAEIRQYNNYYIIMLPGQLLRITTTDNKTTLDIITNLNNAFVSSVNSAQLYGPFVVSNGKLLDENSEDFITSLSEGSKFQVKNIINNRLVPETFSKNGELSKTASLEVMKAFLVKNLLTLDRPTRSAYQFGSLTVAGLPAKEAFDGLTFPDGSFLNRISINFDTDGIKTTYYVQTPDPKELTNKEEDIEEEIPGVEEVPEPKKEEVKIDEPKLESDPKQNTLSDKELEYIYKKPEGGQGIIVDKEGTSPFYTVRRTNYGDIDSQTFAGGLNITNSYFLAEWEHTRNLSEPEDSPGLLLPGTRVNVSIFSESADHGPYLFSFDSTPSNSAPGTIFSADSIGPRYAITLDGGVWNLPSLLENVVNVQEPEGFGGSLLPGTRVSVQLFNNGSDFYISHAPQTFAPPLPGG
jgi:hypothetical protein